MFKVNETFFNITTYSLLPSKLQILVLGYGYRLNPLCKLYDLIPPFWLCVAFVKVWRFEVYLVQAYLQAWTIYSHISTTMPVNFFTTALFHISEYSHLTHTNSQCKEWIFCLLCLHKGPTLMNLNGYRIMIFETGTCGVLQS